MHAKAKKMMVYIPEMHNYVMLTMLSIALLPWQRINYLFKVAFTVCEDVEVPCMLFLWHKKDPHGHGELYDTRETYA